MNRWKPLLPRAIVASLATIALASFLNSAHAEPAGTPIRGRKTPGVEYLDDAILEFMSEVGAQSATVAVAGDGGFFHARAYGHCDGAGREITSLTTTMRIASCSKPFTMAAIKQLVREKKLRYDTLAFPYLRVAPWGGKLGDKRFGEITVQHLLDHEGGFDRDKSGDPMFQMREIRDAMGLLTWPSENEVIQYELAQPLDFDPGERSAYSNFGYMVLGQIVEKASGKSYVEYLNDSLTGPLEIDDLRLSRTMLRDRDAKEVWYPIRDGDFYVEGLEAAGGLSTSAPSLVVFLRNYWINGDPRKTRRGGNWYFFGSLPGTTAFMEQRSDGIDIAVLMNNRRDEHFTADNMKLRKALNDAIDRMKQQR